MAESSGERLLQSIVATARAVFGAAACSLAVLDESETELVFRVADGEGASEIIGVRIPAGRGIAGWALVSGQAIAVADATTDVRFAAETAQQTGYIPRTILATPLVDDGDAVGVMEVLDPGGASADGERALELLGRFADQAVLALQATGPATPDVGPTEQALLDAALAYARSRTAT